MPGRKRRRPVDSGTAHGLIAGAAFVHAADRDDRAARALDSHLADDRVDDLRNGHLAPVHALVEILPDLARFDSDALFGHKGVLGFGLLCHSSSLSVGPGLYSRRLYAFTEVRITVGLP